MKRRLPSKARAPATTTREDFLPLLVHKLRTPVAAAHAANFMLRSRWGSLGEEKILRYLSLQAESIAALRGTLDQVARLSELEVGGGPEGDVASAPEVVSAAVMGLGAEGGRIRLEIGSGWGRREPRDGPLLCAALECVLSNALKFSEKGGVVLVGLALSRGAGCVTVRDHGRGIPRREQSRIFSAFFRASNAGPATGSGLGLAIARCAMERCGGRIEFESREGSGSVFRLYFPLRNSRGSR